MRDEYHHVLITHEFSPPCQGGKASLDYKRKDCQDESFVPWQANGLSLAQYRSGHHSYMLRLFHNMQVHLASFPTFLYFPLSHVQNGPILGEIQNNNST